MQITGRYRLEPLRDWRVLNAFVVLALLCGFAVALPERPARADVVAPFSEEYAADVYGDFITIGNTTLRCPAFNTTCTNASNRTIGGSQAANDNFLMRVADVDTSSATFNSSASQLTIPPGATVAHARLYWSGTTGVFNRNGSTATRACGSRAFGGGDDDDDDDDAVPAQLPPAPAAASPALQQVSLRVGTASAANVAPAPFVQEPRPPVGQAQYYSASADVTSRFAAAATGSALPITVGNVWSTTGYNCYGGWGLTLVYAYPGPTSDAPFQRSVYVYDGHVRQNSTDAATTVTLDGFRAGTGAAARASVVGYEGDWGVTGDQFAINGQTIPEPNTSGVANNFFLSWADGRSNPSSANNFSVDAKSFAVPGAALPPGSTQANLRFSTGGDAYLAQQVAFSVPLPALEVTKTADPAVARAGDPVDFTVTVRNAGGTTIGDLATTDPVAPACARGNLVNLAPAQTQTYTCTGTARANDGEDTYTNTVTASGTTGGTAITASDGVTVPLAEVAITKTADNEQSRAGLPLTFTIEVRNTGLVDLSGVTVTDPATPGCARTIGSLPARGDAANVVTYTCTTDARQTDSNPARFVNTASVEGTPVVPAGSSAVAAVTASSSASVRLLDPRIAITKDATPNVVRAGDPVEFSIVVRNLGDAPLTDVAIADPRFDDCARPDFGPLAAGERRAYTCRATTPTNDVTNVATVTGQPPVGDPVTDRAEALVDVVHPAIAVTKVADKARARAGDPVRYTITATNVGDVPLTGVATADDRFAACSRGDLGQLLVGASAAYTCEVTAPSEEFTNTVTATGQPDVGPAVSDSASWQVALDSPAIAVAKSGPSQPVRAGQDVTFAVVVRNAGDTALTGIGVEDATFPGCERRALPALQPGEATSYDCTVTAPIGDFSNIVVASGQPPTGPRVQAPSGAAEVDVIHPSITVEKEAGTTPVREGDPVVFTITATNTGDVPLTAVATVDPDFPACDRGGLGTLEPGASSSYGCTVTAPSDTFTNTVRASGQPPSGAPVSDDATVGVSVDNPSLRVTKASDVDIVQQGDSVTFDVTVVNDGDVELRLISTQDPQFPVCNSNNLGVLQPTQSASYSCTVQAPQDDFANVVIAEGVPPVGPPVQAASNPVAVDVIHPALSVTKTALPSSAVAGQPITYTITVDNSGDAVLAEVVVTDPVAPGCDRAVGTLGPGEGTTYTCATTAPAGDFTNLATATASPPAGAGVQASASAPVEVIAPDVAIVKTARTPVVRAGGTAEFEIRVVNVGDAPLAAVEVTDALAPDCDRTFPTLAAGAERTYACALADVTEDLTNVAAVTGQPATGPAVSDDDEAEVVVADPAITVSKAAEPAVVQAGTPTTFTITVANGGDGPLSDVTLSDAAVPACDRDIGALAVDESRTVTCETPALFAELENTVVASGAPTVGPAVRGEASASVDVINPSLALSKATTEAQYRQGDTVTFELTAENTGDVALTDVTIADPAFQQCAAVIGDLAPGAVSRTVTCTATAPAQDVTNAATVTGSPPAGPDVSARDEALVDVVHPAIDVTKLTDRTSARAGEPLVFTFIVTNTGDVELTGVATSDPEFDGCSRGDLGELAVGARSSYTCEVIAPGDDVTNSVTASGAAPVGGAVTASADVTVGADQPAIATRLSASPVTVRAGDSVTFTVTATNTGNVTLAGVAISDAKFVACNEQGLGTLQPGESVTTTCTVAAPAEDFANIAVASGQPPTGGRVSGPSDPVAIDVIHPAIAVSKTTAAANVRVGDPVTFTIAVTNSGDVGLSGVTVGDQVAAFADCDRANLGRLGVGEAVSYDCRGAAPGENFGNTVVAGGTPPIGADVRAEVTTVVDVDQPAVTVSKSAAPRTVRAGDSVTFEFAIRNSGGDALSSLALSDPAFPTCDTVILEPLPAGASTPLECTVIAPGEDFTNTAVVSGQPPSGPPVTGVSAAVGVDVVAPAIAVTKIVDRAVARQADEVTFTIGVRNAGDVPLADVEISDAAVPACETTVDSLAVNERREVTCATTVGTDDLTNVVSATGASPVGPPVTDTAQATVDVVAPGLAIAKTALAPAVQSGDAAAFSITVVNTGETRLDGVAVNDPAVPACDRQFTTIAVGDSRPYTCTTSQLFADLDNTAAVTGTPPVGAAVTASDSATVDVINPSLSLDKTTDAAHYRVGDEVTFTIMVTNTGDVGLTDLIVTDELADDCDGPLGDLAPGASATLSCTVLAGDADLTNAALVTGTPPAGLAVRASDEAVADVIHPALTVTKTVDRTSARTGDPVVFTITVTNSGDVALTDVATTDGAFPACARSHLGALAAGARLSYTCEIVAPGDQVTNAVTATATPPVGPTVSDAASVTVGADQPAITAVKVAGSDRVRAGDRVAFTTTVTNAGNVALAEVAVADASFPECAQDGLGTLEPGASTAVTCTVTAPAQDFANVAVASGQPPSGDRVQGASAPAPVDVTHPDVTVEKTTTASNVRHGDPVEFTIALTNTGDVELTDLAVSDQVPAFQECDRTGLGPLPVGESLRYTCVGAAPAENFGNTVLASAQPPVGPPVADSATIAVDIDRPAVAITKSVEPPTVRPGEPLTFTFEVTNTGDVTLVAVRIVDAALPACDGTLTEPLAPGAIATHNCTVAAPASDVVNTAVATAQPPSGPAVSSPSNTVAVDVLNPEITLEKDAEPAYVEQGDTVDFTLTAANTGDLTLRDIELADARYPECASGPRTPDTDTLDPDESFQTGCSAVADGEDLVNGIVPNEASVRAQSAAGEVSDTAYAAAREMDGAITVTKDVVGERSVAPGDAVTFEILVANTGQAPLADVSVRDRRFPECDRDLGDLAVGERARFTCAVTAADRDFSNGAVASGTLPGAAGTVTDRDRAAVAVVDGEPGAGEVRVTKMVDDAVAEPAQLLTFTITVANIGEVRLRDVVVEDTLIPDCRERYEALLPDESRSLRCTTIAGESDFTNEVVVAATGPGGREHVVVDGVTVTVIADAGTTLPDDEPNGRLPYTGLAVGLLAALAAGLVGAGSVLLRATRSRRTDRA